MINSHGKDIYAGDTFSIQSTEILYEGSLYSQTKNPETIAIQVNKVYKEVQVYLLPQVRAQRLDAEVRVSLSFNTHFPTGDVYVYPSASGSFHLTDQSGGKLSGTGAGNTISLSIEFSQINRPGHVYVYVIGVL